MKTIKKEITNEIIINKSKFITILTPIQEVNQINKILENIKKKYKDATHYCYGYKIKTYEKCSDDGEPGGTAGMPILKILKINDLTNILCIVVRYFGGIKLGAGGLVRAYSNSVQEALKKSQIGLLTKGYRITINLEYKNIKKTDYLLKKYDIQKTFKNKITYTFNIEENEYSNIKDKLKSLSDIIEKKEITITKDEN